MKTNIFEITNYLEKNLINWGYDVSRDCSNISNSEYLEFGNEKTDYKKIRISDHALPSTYEGRNGMPFNFDVYSKPRFFAMSYVDLLEKIAKENGLKLPIHVKNEIEKKQETQKQKEEIENYLQNKTEIVKSFEKDMFDWAEINLSNLMAERFLIKEKMAVTPKKDKQNMRKKRIAIEMEIGLIFAEKNNRLGDYEVYKNKNF